MLLRKELVNNGVGKMINLCTAMLLKSLYFFQSTTILDRQTHLLHLLDLCHSLVCECVGQLEWRQYSNNYIALLYTLLKNILCYDISN